MRLTACTRYVLFVCLVFLLSSSSVIGQSQPAATAPAPKPPARDLYQRSLEIHEFKTTATSGAVRGEEIFYFKCSFCHNRYAKQELMRDLMLAPPLEDLHTRKTLRSGDPVSAITLASKIRGGGPAMPAYRYILNDQDIADLVAYVLSDTCCVDGNTPPRNPRYVAGPPAVVDARR